MQGKGEGRRKDGTRPYKEGNTREDGSFAVGKNRTPVETRFAVGDGRKRGRRPKGAKNFETEWEEELSKPVRIKVNGVPKRMTTHRAQVKVTVEAGLKGNIKAQQIVYDRADRVLAKNKEAPRFSDDGLIEAWLAQHIHASAEGIIGDDAAVLVGEAHDQPSDVGREPGGSDHDQ